MRVKTSGEVEQFLARQALGEPFSPTELLLYGTRASIDQVLSRLTREGVIERVGRGIYVRPRHSPLVGAVPPSPVAVARTYARARGIAVALTGAQVLADHGLSTQTPVTPVLSAGVRGRKTIQVGARQVTLQHAPAWVLHHAGTTEGDALAALQHLGRRRLPEARTLLARLPTATQARLLDLRPTLPGWLADLLTLCARQGASPDEARP